MRLFKLRNTSSKTRRGSKTRAIGKQLKLSQEEIEESSLLAELSFENRSNLSIINQDKTLSVFSKIFKINGQ